MYTNTEASVKLNDSLSSWFPCTSGVQQGDNLSPTLFALFTNDLAEEIKTLDCGITIDEIHVCCLLYADYLMLLSDSEDNTQRMLDQESNWRNKWRYWSIIPNQQLCISGTKGSVEANMLSILEIKQ